MHVAWVIKGFQHVIVVKQKASSILMLINITALLMKTLYIQKQEGVGWF